jgi:hypothetical protein
MIVVWVMWVYASGAWVESDQRYTKKSSCELWAGQYAETSGQPTVCRKTKIPAPPKDD